MIAQVSKLLTHFGCRSGVGIQLQASMELLILEMGLTAQPLQESYKKYGPRITHSWIKSIWEKVSKYKIGVQIAPLDIQPPRERDRWFMRAVEEAGINDPKELCRINRTRIHQQVLYVSDVLEANGKTIDHRYMMKRPPEDRWSNINFSNENPPPETSTFGEKS